MPKINIQKEILINENLDKMKAILMDFKQMVVWSPWNIIEPDANMSFSESQASVGASVNAWQEWDGKIIGAGRMEIIHIGDDEINFNLEFFKPFKSKAKTSFKLEEIDGKTKVIWDMDSSLPCFMFFFAKMMIAMIGMDYERGLRMLKEYVETGEIASKLVLDANTHLKDMKYIGVENHSSVQDIGENMKRDFGALFDFAKEQNVMNEKTEYFTVYNKFDLVKGTFDYVAAMSIEQDVQIPDNLIHSNFIKANIQQSKAVKVTHTGRYEHLGNAWSLAMSHPKSKCGSQKMRIQKKPVGYEFYLNSPQDTDPKDLITEVVIALK